MKKKDQIEVEVDTNVFGKPQANADQFKNVGMLLKVGVKRNHQEAFGDSKTDAKAEENLKRFKGTSAEAEVETVSDKENKTNLK